MTEIDADRPSYTNDRAQVTEEMVNVYIETMWPDLSALQRRAIADLRAQVRTGLTAALAAAPKPDQPSASTIETMAKEAVQAREYLSGLLTHFAPQCKPLADLYGLCTQIDNLLVGMAAPKPDDGVCSPLPAEVSEADIDTMHMWYNHPDSGATHDARLRSAIAAVFRAHATPPKPDQPEWAPPSSARPENGSATMAEAARDVAAEDFAIMLRRMIWQTRKATGDDSMKVLSGQAEALLSRHGMVGNPLRADGPTPQPGEA